MMTADMKTVSRWSWIAIIALVLSWALPGEATATELTRLDVKRLHSFDAASPFTMAADINDKGHAVGSSDGADDRSRAIAWNREGQPRQLPCLDGDLACWASAINNRGVVVGRSYGESDDNAVRWNRRGEVEVLALPAGEYGASAHDINDAGWVAGLSWSPDGFRRSAVIWDETGTPRQLPPLRGHVESEALALGKGETEKWLAVGVSSRGYPEPDVPVGWNRKGKVKKLRLLPGHVTGHAWGTSDSGVVAGWSQPSGPLTPSRAVVWHGKRQPTALPLLEDCTHGTASDINLEGAVTGFCFGLAVPLVLAKPVIWSEDGAAFALPMVQGVDESGASKINSKGDVVGWAWLGTTMIAVLWSAEIDEENRRETGRR